MDAFWCLHTERQIGMCLGQIPESRIVSHAERAGLDGGSMVLFRAAIRAQDDVYLKWVEERRKRLSRKE